MKILRIAGANLASLADFQIDFEAEPLRTAGVYAITGPTGAGKSTLLDAMCLALYGETPRISGRGGAQVLDGYGKDGAPRLLAANQVGNVLRRGAGVGFAEVDFLGVDQERYRARWELRRAHSRPDGTLQAASSTLHRLTSNGMLAAALGGTVTETKQAIAAKVGLEFDQFRRAVLLAQGDFAAFLRAKPDERAALLERMTGTAIYAEISRQAHLEARSREAARAALEQDRAGLALASDAERAGWAQAVSEIASKVQACDQRLAAASDALSWHERSDALTLARAQAEAELGERQAAFEAEAPLRQQLEEVAAAEAWRPTFSAATRLRLDASRSADAAEVARAVTLAAQTRRDLATTHAAQALRQREELDAAQAAERPSLDAARSADAALDQLRQQASTLAAEAQTRRRARDSAAEALDTLTRQRTTCAEAEAAADKWLQDHPGALQLAELATALRPWILGAIEASERLPPCRATVAEAAAAAEASNAEVVAARGVEAEARAGAEAAARLAVRAGESRDAIDSASVQEALARGQAAEAALREAERALIWLSAARHQSAEAAASQARAQAEFEAARQQAAAALAAAPQVSARLTEARDALSRWELSLDLAAHRHLLRAGEPCPLCGSCEHPSLADAPAPAGRDAQRRRVEDLEAQHAAVLATAVEGQARADAASRRTADAASLLARAASESAEAAGALAVAAGPVAAAFAGDHVAGLAGAEVPDWQGEGAASALATRRQDWTTALAQLGASLKRWTQAVSDAAAAEAAATTARGSLEKALIALDTCQRRARDAEQSLAMALQRDSAAVAALNAATGRLTALDAHLVGWREQLEMAPAALLLAFDGVVAAALRWREERDRCRAQLQALALNIAAAEVALKRDIDELAAAVVAATTAAWALQRDEAARQQLLGGQAVGAVEREQARQLREARARESTASSAANDAQTALANAAGTADERTRLAEVAAAARIDADAELAELLGRLEIAEATLAARLGHDARWRAEATARLQAVREARVRAEGAATEARARAAQHLQSPAPAADRATALDDERSARIERDGLNQELGRLHEKLAADDRRRGEAEVLLRAIAVHDAAAAPWLQLDDAVGSGDGSKFQKFAQGLTLAILTEHANAHLRQLSHRYQLRRVPTADLDLQVVDGDMADEVRALTTLSGGETFLVSLALALGLASICSRSATMESLFIDEGFGTLDPATLEVALAALEGLGDDGRKVGVISHVQNLADRLEAEVCVEPCGGGLSVVKVRRMRSGASGRDVGMRWG